MRIIRGKYGRRRFEVPKNITARPTTDFARENIFNVLENMTDFEGLRALDLFAGTGAVSFELLSRGCLSVTAVEKAATQYNFICSVATRLGDRNMHALRTDALRFIDTAGMPFDFIFADPPYDMEGFGDIPVRILRSGLLKKGGIFVMEHSGKYDFSELPFFYEHRAYGSVNFSIFVIPDEDAATSEEISTTSEDDGVKPE
ncbi:MAG: RsmD family RNA methyltransferase [Bacteroidales bacterium]|nr:RsmD family RNA methyltransferase [Bacteroidales bacterium]